MRTEHAFALFGMLLLGGALAAACGNTGAYAYMAEQYQPSGCIANGFVLGVFEGAGAQGGCTPTCFVFPDDAGIDGVATYVSSECPPYPLMIDAGPGNCAQALAALAAGFYCLPDGGNPPGDAAFLLPFDAAGDAGTDAPASPALDAGGSDAAAD